MARLTFKQYIKENKETQFVPGPMVLMPPKKIKDPKDPSKLIDNPKYKEFQDEDLPTFGGPSDQVSVSSAEPEETDFRSKAAAAIAPIESTGSAKLRTLASLGANTAGRSDMQSRFAKGRRGIPSPYYVPPEHLGSQAQVINPPGKN